jgi:hypothetical protein
MLDITYLLRVAEAVGSCDDPEVVDETDSLSGIASMLHLVNA